MIFTRNCTIATVILFGDILICLALLIPMLVRRKRMLTRALDYLTFALVSSGLIFSTTFFIINIRNLVDGGMSKGSCDQITILIFLVMGAIIWIHMIIAIERYFVLVQDNNFRTTHRWLVFILSVYSIASISFLIGAGYYFDNIVAFESEWWCFLRFTSSETWHTATAWVLLAFIFITSSTIIFCYFSIYLKVKEMKRRNALLLGVQDKANIANKFLFIFVAFCLTYTPSFLTFIYRFAFKLNISPDLEFACSLLPTLEAGITCSLLFYLNANYREAFKAVFCLQDSPFKSLPSTSKGSKSEKGQGEKQ